MHQGNWTCSSCGGAIKELPFQPRSNSGLTCRDCYFNKKDGGSGSASTASNDTAEVDTGGSADIDDRDVPPFDPEGAGSASEPAPASPEMEAAPVAEKKTFTGDWKCSMCEGPITELPFEPRSTDGLKCRDCFRK